MFRLVAGILGIVVLLNLALMFFQSRMIFFPLRSIGETPSDWGLEYEDVYLTTSDNIQIHGWYIPGRNAQQTLLFFHGNAGNISHRDESIKIFHRLGLNVFILDYRGYGKSKGRPSEAGLYEDGHSAWQYLVNVKHQQPDNIIIFGRSLGGAVATKLAGDVEPRALILESVFSSIEDMAQAFMPLISRILFLRFTFDNGTMIKQVHCPVLIMHSPEDDIIPFEQGTKVFMSANEPKTFIQLRGDHNSGFILSQPLYERNLAAFLATLDSDKKK